MDATPSHRPLVNIYRANGEEIGKMLLKGFAREWRPGNGVTGAGLTLEGDRPKHAAIDSRDLCEWADRNQLT